MLQGAAAPRAVGCCGTCLDARGLSKDLLVEGASRSTLEVLTDWTLCADRTLTYLVIVHETPARQRRAPGIPTTARSRR